MSAPRAMLSSNTATAIIVNDDSEYISDIFDAMPGDMSPEERSIILAKALVQLTKATNSTKAEVSIESHGSVVVEVL